MLANVIALSILGLLVVLASAYLIKQRIDGVPSCGYECGEHACASCSAAKRAKMTREEKQRVRAFKKRLREKHDKSNNAH